MDTEHTHNKENIMGTKPVNRLLLSLGLPMIASMMVSAFYNIVDSIFVARITEAGSVENAGTAALVAVGMAFPFQTLIIAFSAGTGVGMNALLSRALGEKDFNTVNKTAVNGIFCHGVCYIFFLLAGIFLPEILIKAQGGSGLSLIYGSQYLRIVCMCSFGVFTQFTFERLLQSTGKTIYSMITQMTGAIINIILDPILIFGLFGFPSLKVAGAAIATVIGQICAGSLAIFFNLKKNHEISISFKGFKPNAPIIGKIYSVGLPSIVMQSIGSVMTYSMNSILNSLNEASVAVFTVYFKLQSFFFLPLFGMNNALIPIIAYNYGAKKRGRIISAIRYGMIYAGIFMGFGFIMFEVFPEALLKIFDTNDQNLILYGVPALRIIAFHFLIAWFCIIAGSTFQALGNGVYSLIVSVARQLVVLIPVAYILAKIGGLSLIWWSFPIAELMSLLCSLFFLRRISKNIISGIPE